MLKIDQLTSKGVQNYVQVCTQYCACLEQLAGAEASALYLRLVELLPGLYRGNLRLPKVTLRYVQDPERFVTEKQYKNLLRQLSALTGPRDRFPFINYPHDVERLAMADASVAELLSDIYLEVKDFVSLYGTGTLEDMNDALAENQDTFRQEWGLKVLTVLNILHLYCFGEASSSPAGGYHHEEPSPEGFDASELQGFGTETE